MALIRCENVSIGYEGQTVVRDLEFSIDAGDYLCIVGENGSGKSTLVRSILGLKNVEKGRIIYGDGLKKNEIGYLPQQTDTQKDFPASVYEVVLSGRLNSRGLKPFYTNADKRAAEEKMELLGIRDLAKQCYRDLSGGQKQRALLARALCATKTLLLLDEPVTGLDPIVTSEFYQLIRRINRESGIAVVMVSHDIESAVEDASHILHLQEKMLFFGTAEEYRTENRTGARLLGMHLEGPFFSPDGAGAQNPAFLRDPDIALVDEWNAVCPVKKVSFSPELPGSAAFTRELAKRGIMPSGAHSLAGYEVFEEMRMAGMKHLTHFCNVLTPLHHLKFGFVGGGLLAKDVFVEIITDGVHLCNEMIELILSVKGCEKVMMITDSMRAAGMPDGDYSLGGLPVIVKNGRATLPSGRVAGSTLLYHNGVKRLLEVTHLPPKELIKCTSWNQARSLNLEGYGRLEPGYHADLVVLDAQWNPLETWVGGMPRWRREAE